MELTRGALEKLVGEEAVTGLLRLASRLGGGEGGGESGGGGVRYEPSLIFARKYSAGSRPWIGFHHDVSTCTINVALSDDREHAGGRLHAIVGDGTRARHATIERAEGEATAHGDDVMHAVSAMRAGTRYSLILFFYALADDAGSLAYQSVPRAELMQERAHEAATSPTAATTARVGASPAPDDTAGGLLQRRRAGGGSQWDFR